MIADDRKEILLEILNGLFADDAIPTKESIARFDQLISQAKSAKVGANWNESEDASEA